MIYDRMHPDFQPKDSTLEQGLYLRKKAIHIAGVTHPGLHGIYGLSGDAASFFLVVILEITGLVLIGSIMVDSDADVSISAIVAGGIFLFLFEVVVAYFHQRLAAGKCTHLRVKKIILSQNKGRENDNEIERIDRYIRFKGFVSALFSFLIVVVAVLKFVVFLGLSSAVYAVLPIPEVAAAFMIYMICAFLNIRSTGFFLSFIYANFLYNRDYSLFVKKKPAGMDAQVFRLRLRSHDEYERWNSVGEHKIIKDNNEFVLETKGVLLDKEIEDLAAKILDVDAKRDFCLAAIELQLSSLKEAAV